MSGTTVLPGTIIRKGSYATAGSIVDGDIREGSIISGKDSSSAGHVSMLINMETMTRHPWMKHFYQKYPADAQDRIIKLYNEIIESKITRG